MTGTRAGSRRTVIPGGELPGLEDVSDDAAGEESDGAQLTGTGDEHSDGVASDGETDLPVDADPKVLGKILADEVSVCLPNWQKHCLRRFCRLRSGTSS